MMRAMHRRPATQASISVLSLATALALAAVGLLACQSEPVDRLEQMRRLQSSGAIEDSIEPLAEMIEGGDLRGETLYRYGRALSVTGQPGRAVWALDAAREDPDWFVNASHQLALNASASGNHDLALETLRRLADEREDDHAEDVPARLLEIRVLIATRRMYEEALDQVEVFLDEYPENEEAIRLKAVALLGIGEPDEAYELIREADIRLVGGDETDADPTETDLAGETPLEAPAEAEPLEDGEADEAELDPELAAEQSRERYWCTVRVTFKREAGQLEEALTIADECLAKHPASIEILNEASQVYAAVGRYRRIREALEAAVEAEPDDRHLRSALVDHLRQLGRQDEAEAVIREALDAAIALDPPKPIQTAALWVDLAGHLIENERLDEGLDAYVEALELLGDLASAELRFRYADALILAERYDEAIAAIEGSPVEVYPPMIKGRAAFERADYGTALEELDKVALLWPDNAPTRYYLARAAEGAGDIDRAIEEYRQAMRSDPLLHAARERLIRLHLAEGRVRDAQTIYRFNSPKKGGKADPSVEMKILQIEIQTRLGNEPDLSIPPDVGMPVRKVQTLAVDALRRGLVERVGPAQAVETLAALESQVVPSSRDLFARAQVEILLEDEATHAQALEVARRAEKALSERPMASLALARAQVRNRVELDDAARRLEAIIEVNPTLADALEALGELALLRGDAAQALDHYDRAVATSPDHWGAVRGRTRALSELGREAEAIETLEAYLATEGPYDGDAALALARRLPESERTRRVALAHRAIRFGAGPHALDFLAALDPQQAKRYRVEKVVEAPEPSSPTDAS